LRAFCGLALRFGRRLEDDDDASAPASRTHQAAFEPGEREVAPARPDQRVQVQLLPINARPRVRAVIDNAARYSGP